MRLIAHRGLHLEHPDGPVPENTLAAMSAAVADPRVGGFEVDLRVLGDGTAVIFHDEDTKRLVGKRHRLSDLDVAAWAQLRTPDGHPFPTVVGAMPWFEAALARPGFEVHLELKASSDFRPLLSGLLEPLTALYASTQGHDAGRLTVSSFDPRFLFALHAHFPSGDRPELALIVHRRAALDALALLPRDGLAIHADHDLIDDHPELLETWAQRGYPVRVWTVDSPKAALELAAISEPFRPRAVLSDRPLALAAALAASYI